MTYLLVMSLDMSFGNHSQSNILLVYAFLRGCEQDETDIKKYRNE